MLFFSTAPPTHISIFTQWYGTVLGTQYLLIKDLWDSEMFSYVCMLGTERRGSISFLFIGVACEQDSSVDLRA
jgi:hypothetical protein